jgi:acyl-coenzyme A synthetase/AMP-(fatty) acid ligase
VVDLILFVQLREDNDCKRAAFVNHLTGAFPAYMRPRSIRFVVRLPVTLHGKIDRRRLSYSCSEAAQKGTSWIQMAHAEVAASVKLGGGLR